MSASRILSYFGLLTLSLLLMSSTLQAAPSDPYSDFFNDSFGDLQEELDVAKEEGKKGVMLFFEMDDCPFCTRMKKSILSKDKVQQYYRDNFRLLAIDIEGDLELTDFQGNGTTQKEFAEKQHRVRATPVIAFFDLEGNKITKYTGAAGSPEEFMLLGKYIVEGHYKTMKFTKYKRANRK